MRFSLEVLPAKKGDAMLLHLGDRERPVLAVIDGGPAGVFRESLAPRLRQLRDERGGRDALAIDWLLVSHIDDDHINGILDLTSRLRERKQDRQPLDYRIRNLWHNSFDDVVGNRPDELRVASLNVVGPASLDAGLDDVAPISTDARMLLASVPQGRALREDAKLLRIAVNAPRGELVVAEPGGAPSGLELAPGVEIVVLGPSASRVRELQRRWDDELRRRGLEARPDDVRTAAFLDTSVYNLASIVVLLRAGKRRMLLTGDARGDDIVAGAAEAGVLNRRGRLTLDVLKVPHHGSDRNVDTDFFWRFRADHYVISGDGSHGNPEPAMFEMLFEARRRDKRPFTIHLTYPPREFRAYHGKRYPVEALESLIEAERVAGRRFKVKVVGHDPCAERIDLLDEL